MKKFLLIILFFSFAVGCRETTIEQLNIDRSVYKEPVKLQLLLSNFADWSYKAGLVNGFSSAPIDISDGYRPATDPVAIPIQDVYGCRKGCPYSPFPLNCSYAYPVTNLPDDIESYLVKFVVTSFTPMTIYKWEAEVKYNDGSVANISIFEDGNTRDGNILTGSVLLKEDRYYGSTDRFNSVSTMVNYDMDNKVIYGIKYDIYYWNQDKAKISIEIPDGYSERWQNSFNLTIDKIYFTNSYVLEHKIKGKWNGKLVDWSREITGKDWQYSESISYDEESNSWLWKRDNNDVVDFDDNFNIKDNLYNVCISDSTQDSCNIIIKDGKVGKIKYGDYVGTGECDLTLLSGSCSMSVTDATGKFSASFLGELQEDNSFNFKFKRDLSLTGQNPDETGETTIISSDLLWGTWKKNWGNDQTINSFIIFYPTVLVNNERLSF